MQARYHPSLIALHWLMALAIIAMLVSGIVIEEMELTKAVKYDLLQLHKSTGVILLLALVVRIILKLRFKAPALPANFNDKDRQLANAGHVLLYVLMAIMTLSGWIMVSASKYGLPTIVYGLFEFPHIPFIESGDKVFSQLGHVLHGVGSKIMILMLIIHIAAVIKHKVSHHTNLVKRIWW